MIAKVTAWAKRHPAWSALIAVVVVLAVVAPFVLPGAPNLDDTVAGESASSIRERIVGHRDWGEKLSDEQLDQLAAFIAENAGRGAAERDGVRRMAPEPIPAVWEDNDCGSCHTLAAADGD